MTLHRPSFLPSWSIGRISRWPRPHRHESQVVGGHVAPLPTSGLHQAPLRVASLVVGLQDADRLAGPNRDLVVPSRREAVSGKHLEKERRGRESDSGRVARGASGCNSEDYIRSEKSETKS